jgi:o-succinylbenzoate---CoA ligase
VEVDSWLVRAARRRPDGEAVNGTSYAELLDRARRLDLDVAAGTRVGLALPPGTDFAVALHATWLRGAVAVPHDLRLTPGERPAADVVLTLEAMVEGPPPPAGGGPSTVELDATAVVLQTSGTTGRPKEVHLTFGNLLWSALGSAVALGVDPQERWVSALPVSHVGGLGVVVRSAVYGTACRLHERWDTETVLAELQRGEGTLITVVPTVLQRLLDAGLDHPPRLRWAVLGGAPVTEALVARARAAGVPMAPTYGLTEATSQVVTFGVPLFCTRVELAEDGEVLVSGPTVAAAEQPLRTGDLGRWEADGTLSIVGRKSELLISGGENVMPAEVEAVLEAHPDVAEAAVLGREDPEWGEAVVALVRRREGATVTEAELREHAAARLARFKVPKAVRWVTVLPRTASGKLRRAELAWDDRPAD